MDQSAAGRAVHRAPAGYDVDDVAHLVITCDEAVAHEWLAAFADPIREQSALDRFTSGAYDLVIEGESYRTRLKPRAPAPARTGPARG